ncbi:class IV lanthionine synthetase LanL [Streptosporangiaceae bacterium NEAU-GS5]|nr:class IV lanthionine synthetase LanL [Streptosporangiaceae bacterium NEAU-GS5]
MNFRRETQVAARTESATQFPFQTLVRTTLDEHGGAAWTLADDGFWCRANPPEPVRRVQGWKIHVSATPLSAPEVLHRSAMVLAGLECAFKFPARAAYIAEMTGGRYDRAQCGKVITAYPRDDAHFREVAEALDEITAGLPGPAILSDRPYGRGGLVHYRFGAFGGVPTLTNDGTWEVRLRDPSGAAVPDVRKPWFCPPEWAVPPLPEPPPAPAVPGRPVLLNGRYVVREAIRHSSRGGVYFAYDQIGDTTVVIKQARAHVAAGLTGEDARAALRREAAALRSLSGLTAELIEVFDQEDHTFLVESRLPGMTLTEWAQCQMIEAPDDAGLAPERAVALAARLAALLAEVHRRGLVYRDLSPNNIIVMPDGELRLIDPELAAPPGRRVTPAHTPGFAPPEYVSDGPTSTAPGPEADCYALGAILFHLVTGANPALSEDAEPARPDVDRLGLILDIAGAHRPAARRLAPAIRGLCAVEIQDRWTLDRLSAFLAAPDVGGSPGRSVPYDRLIEDGLTHILTTMDPTDPTDGAARLWPSGAFGSETEPSNVQHGAAGVLALLVQAHDTLGRDDLAPVAARVARWIQRRLPRVPTVLPGLYFGQAGTALALWEAARALGDDELADEAAEIALSLPVRWPNPDVFHGAAGAGMAQLHLWHATGREVFLDRAADCADGLLAAAQYAEDGVYWPIPKDFDSALAGISHFGFAHGAAGVGTFLLDLALAADRQDCLEAALAAGETLIGAAEHGPWGARWRSGRADPPGSGLLYYQCSGSSGVGTFLLRLWQATGHPGALDLARQAAAAVYRTRWSAGSAVCHGLAGNGHFLLDLAEAAGDEPYREWAEELAACLYARHARLDGLLVLPDESGSDIRVDYQVGSSGALGFLLRLRYGGPRPWMVTAPAHAGSAR